MWEAIVAMRNSTLRGAAAVLAVFGLIAAPAGAAVPFQEIGSAGPLTSVALGNDLSCQVAHTGDSGLELFPSGAKPGDCGTFVAVGTTLYAPNFAAHDSTATSSIGAYTPLAPVSQTPVTGSGTAANPYRVTTVAGVGATGLQVTQVDSYVIGQESYRTDVTLQNGSGAPVSGVVYRAGDCYLQGSDTGYGFVNGSAVGCSVNASNTPPARIEQWFPLTAGNQYMEGRFSEVWAQIGTHAPFQNTARGTESLDNGAGVSWTFSVAAGATATFSHYTTFSPTGNTGPPVAARPSTAFGSNGVADVPSNRRCVSRRYFRIRVRRKYWASIAAVTVRMPRTTRVLRRPPWGTIVDLRGLPRGRFSVRITALTIDSRTIKGTRHYRTCRGRLRGGRPKL
jgi:hypothetical protein